MVKDKPKRAPVTKLHRALRKSLSLKQIDASLRAFALSLPAAYEEFPWEERVIKVNKKVFAFLGILPAPWNVFRLTIKLPQSNGDALMFPFAEPSGYGLGKSGWVTLKFAEGEDVPVDMLQTWLVESYRAIAPKKLVAQLDAAKK